MRMRFAPIWVALVAGGCNGGQAGADMRMSNLTCTQMSMDQSPYLGAAKGALDAAKPPILDWQADAYLTDVRGNLVTLNGVTTSGMNGGQWVVTYYSPSAKRLYVAAYSSLSGHVSCQDVNVGRTPHMQPDPMRSSKDVVATAVARINAATFPNPPMLPMRLQNVEYGEVTVGVRPSHDKAWVVNIPPFGVIVDDATGDAIECDNGGADCIN